MSKDTILVVEPDDDIRNTLRVYFSGQGYEVISCDNSQVAWASLREKLPSIILSETDLPDTDGWEFLRQIRQTPRTSHVPMIFISERNSREDKEKALQLGVDDYVAKPFDIEELKLRIWNAIPESRTRYSLNPTSGFPTGHMIEAHLRELMRKQTNDWVYIDIKIGNFDAFKELYSWQKGDEIIKALALIIHEALEQFGTEDDFAGHPGGDNFILITHTKEIELLLENLRVKFNQYVEGLSRSLNYEVGDKAKTLLSLSNGVFDVSKVSVKDIREITELAAEDRRRKDPNYVANQDDDDGIVTEW